MLNIAVGSTIQGTIIDVCESIRVISGLIFFRAYLAQLSVDLSPLGIAQSCSFTNWKRDFLSHTQATWKYSVTVQSKILKQEVMPRAWYSWSKNTSKGQLTLLQVWVCYRPDTITAYPVSVVYTNSFCGEHAITLPWVVGDRLCSGKAQLPNSPQIRFSLSAYSP